MSTPPDDMGVRLTYAEIDDKAARLASWLREQGIQNGDVVTFQMPPELSECAILYVACLKVGAVIHPLAVTFNGEDLVYAMNLVESKAFIAPTFHHKTNFEDQNLLGGRAHPFSSDQCDRSSRQNGRCEIGHYAQRESSKNTSLTRVKRGSKSDEVVLILSTSGTTGRPKAVLITHNALLFSERAFSTGLGLTKDDVMFMPAPLNHATGFNHGLITPLPPRRSRRSRASLQP